MRSVALLHPQREERADNGKDDVVEARKWIPNTPYIINTRARRCACIFIRLAAIKASNCIIVSLDSRRRFILADKDAHSVKVRRSNFGGICEQIRSIFSQRRRPNFGG